MPATDYQGSSSPFASLGRSILSIKRDQVHSMEPHHELECFQKQVADLFHGLATGGEDLLSLSWIGKLLDAFLICQEKFRVIRWNSNSSEAEGGLNMMSRGPPPPPLDRLIAESFERSVKALDVCNAIRDGIERVRQWQKHLEIVLVALDPSNKRRTTATTTLALGEGQLRRAKKALVDLTIAMLDEKGASSVVAHRNRSFGGRNNNNNNNNNSKDRFRSLSWSVSRSWSAGRQLQAIGNNLAAPRGNEIIATNGLAVPIFTMDSVLLFSMWSLVAAIPCQCRDLQLTHFSIPPRTFPWAPSILLLHERILEESKKKDRRNSNGLLKEIHQIEKCMRHLTDLIDTAQFPLVEERQLEARQRVEDLALLCDALKDGLDPLEHQVREVFRSIVRNRTEGLDCLARGGAQS